MRFAHLQVAHRLARRAQDAACSNGGFVSPTLGQTVDSLKPLNISWDTTCLDNVQSIDIVLSAPGNANPLIQGWESVSFASGFHVVELLPRKWNDSASQQLQLNLYQSGTPSFMSPLPAGPVFTATYAAPSSGPVPAAADLSLTNSNTSAAASSSSHGKTAAAVLLPLLVVIAAIVAYIRIKRRRGRDKRKRWSEMVDKRMSTISTDWKSMSAAGAQAAIRNSMAVSSRNSAFSFGAIRPPSMVADPTSPDMAQIRRPGTGLRNAALAEAIASGERVSRVSFADTANRVSRVSFAADPRPSADSRRTVGSTRASRAFHTAYTPPVPSLPPVYSPKEKVKENKPEDVDVSLSPRQTAGPLTLSPEDIRTRIQSGNDDDDVLPALAMMRTGSRASNNPFVTMAHINEEQANEYILPSSSITMPEPTHYSPTDVMSFPAPSFPVPVPSFPVPMIDIPPPSAVPISPTNLLTPLPPAAASSSSIPSDPYMSPDNLLRLYAERQAANSSPAPISRSNTASPFGGVVSGSTPDDMLRAYAERRTSAGVGINRSDNSPSPFSAMPSSNNEGTTPDDMLRAYAVRRGTISKRNSGNGKLEKRPSFTGGAGAFVGGFALALTGKKGKKSRESRRVTPPLVAPSASSSSSSLTGSTGGTALYQLPPVEVSYTVTETHTVDNDPFANFSGVSMAAVRESSGSGRSSGRSSIGGRERAESVGVGLYGGARYAIGEAPEEELADVDEEQAYGGTA